MIPDIERYEEYLKALEEGIAALEKGSLSLSNSLKQYQYCQELSRVTEQILGQAERASLAPTPSEATSPIPSAEGPGTAPSPTVPF